MLLAFDTYYTGTSATTACISIRNWNDDRESGFLRETIQTPAPYVPGEFYKRELPCILHLLSQIELQNIEAIIIDGYVYLDDKNRLGLGGRLYEAIHKKTPVIGVAKTNFAAIRDNKTAIFRGKSHHPLYVTAIGIDPAQAALHIQSMHGENRIPTLLKRLDELSRGRS